MDCTNIGEFGRAEFEETYTEHRHHKASHLWYLLASI
jgi:hypothetical protein